MAEMEILTTRGHDKDMLITGFKRDLANAADEIERLRSMHADMCRVAGAQADEIERLSAENRFLFEIIKDDALLVERYNAFNERRLDEQSAREGK